MLWARTDDESKPMKQIQWSPSIITTTNEKRNVVKKKTKFVEQKQSNYVIISRRKNFGCQSVMMFLILICKEKNKFYICFVERVKTMDLNINIRIFFL